MSSLPGLGEVPVLWQPWGVAAEGDPPHSWSPGSKVLLSLAPLCTHGTSSAGGQQQAQGGSGCPRGCHPLPRPWFLDRPPHIFQELKSTDMKYRNRVRSRLSNLKDPKNPSLRRKVLRGAIPPSLIARMSAEVGAPPCPRQPLLLGLPGSGGVHARLVPASAGAGRDAGSVRQRDEVGGRYLDPQPVTAGWGMSHWQDLA